MPKKNILLLYITEVSGHHSASLAVEKAIRMSSDDAEILNINAFRYTSPITEKIVNRIYATVIRKTPKIWDYLYDNPKVKRRLDIYREAINSLNSPKLKKLFDQFRPDAVVCTQAYPCGMVANYKRTYKSNLPLIAVLTDYVPHVYWLSEDVNYYVTPSQEISQRLIKRGVAPSKIKALGIPFDPAFNQTTDKNSVMQKLNLDPDLKTVLIMGGGQGLGPIKTIIRSLEKVKAGMQEIIVCGTNKKLYNSLKKKNRKYNKKILLYAYTTNVSDLMTASDIIITKPGGITTSEALTKKLPLLIIKPIPGQEMNNTEYLTSQGAAIRIDKPKKINIIIEDLLTDPDKLKKLSRSAAAIAKPNAAVDIARFVLDL